MWPVWARRRFLFHDQPNLLKAVQHHCHILVPRGIVDDEDLQAVPPNARQHRGEPVLEQVPGVP